MQNQNIRLVLIDVDDLFEKRSFPERIKILYEKVGVKDVVQFSTSFQSEYKDYKKGILKEEDFYEKLRDKLKSWVFVNSVMNHLPGKKIEIDSLTNEKIKEVIINYKFKIEENDLLKGLNQFLGQNDDCRIAFINGNDFNTANAMNSKIITVLREHFSSKNRKIFQVCSHDKYTSDKQKLSINLL